MPLGSCSGDAMIDQKDFLHGAALVAIADSSQFTALNKDEGYGHYFINHDRHVFIKHTNMPGTEFKFTYTPGDIRRIRQAAKQAKTFAVLVCSHQAIAALTAGELGEVIDLTSSSTQWLRIIDEPRKSLRICGSVGSLTRTIPKGAFPKPVLE
jgi:hypothetical protein